MNTKLLSLCASLLLAGLASGCKKSDPTTSAASESSAAKPATGAPDQPVELKIKWPLGSRYVYRMDIQQNSEMKMPQMPKPMKQEVNMGQSFALSVLKERAGGGRELAMEFLGQEMEVKMGEQVVIDFDSKVQSPDESNNPFAAPYRKMIGTRLNFLLGPDGKVEKVEGFDEWVDKITEGAPPPATMMFKQTYNEDYFKLILDFSRGLPNQPVKPGDSWPTSFEITAPGLGKIQIDMNTQFKGWDQHEARQCAVLESSGTIKSKSGQPPGPYGQMTVESGKMSSTSWFDPALGSTVESAIDQTMALKINLPGQPGGAAAGAPMTSDMKQKVTMKLVEVGKVKK